MFLLPISIGLAWCLYSALFHPMTEKYYRVWRVKSEESVLSAGHADCFLLAGCSSERGLNGDAAFVPARLLHQIQTALNLLTITTVFWWRR